MILLSRRHLIVYIDPALSPAFLFRSAFYLQTGQE